MSGERTFELPDEPFVSLGAAARYLGRNKTSMHRYLHSGRLGKPKRVGAKFLLVSTKMVRQLKRQLEAAEEMRARAVGAAPAVGPKAG